MSDDKDPQRISDAADNCEVLRARLAKYEDDQGNPHAGASEPMALPFFAQKVIAKLKRFEECASDSGAGGVDIGRHWLDLLTQLGLLNRVQRSPGIWEISQQGEDLLATPAAGCQHGGE